MRERRLTIRTLEERNRLVEQWLNLVPWTIYRNGQIYRRMAKTIGADDAEQVGRLGLIRAADTWQEPHSKFITWAVKHIRWAVSRKWRLMRKQSETVPMAECPFDKLLTEQSPVAGAELIELRGLLDIALSGLNEQKETVLRLRIGAWEGKNLSLQETGLLLGLTRERVRQIEMAAVRKLFLRPATRVIGRDLGLFLCRQCGWKPKLTNCRYCKSTGCCECIRWRELSMFSILSCEDCYDGMRRKEKSGQRIGVWSAIRQLA